MENMLFNPFVQRTIGIGVIFLVGIIASNDRKKINWKSLFSMFLFLIFSAWVLLNFEWAIYGISIISKGFLSLYEVSSVGIDFLFGSLADSYGPTGFIFAIKVLPMVIFFSALISLLNYCGIIQKIIEGISFLIQPILGTNGPETLNAVGNCFIGQTEAPILIRNYLKSMSDSELFAVMVSGMGTITCGLVAVYGSLGIAIDHLLISGFLSIPATLLISKLWFPATSTKKERVSATYKKNGENAIDAISQGASEGLMLCLNIGAMLLATISFLYLLDSIIIYISQFFFKDEAISLEYIFGYIMYPFSWCLGIEKSDLIIASNLLGIKTVVNEMIAYTRLINYSDISDTTKLILTYALCGFANFSSIGIQIGGIGSLEPSIRGTLSRLGIRAVFAAFFSNLLVACVVGFFI